MKTEIDLIRALSVSELKLLRNEIQAESTGFSQIDNERLLDIWTVIDEKIWEN